MDKFKCSSTITKRKMGSQQKNTNFFHFSHPHPLQYTTSSSPRDIATCFGCNLRINDGEYYYQCKTCPFFSLHYVCYNMPLITNHLAHLMHDLVLIAIPSISPSSTKTTLNCVACGHHVTGLCYHCAECNTFFHTFCLALPLSIALTHHPHKIHLEFSPPYAFFCDLCNKPSNYKGWLYRCSMCEFDTHIACAIENLEPHSIQHPSFAQSNALLKQLMSTQMDHAIRLNGSVGDSSIGYEIMSLVAHKIGGGNNNRSTGLKKDQLFDDGAVIGWDKRLYSSRKMHNRSSDAKRKIVELQEIDESCLEERTPLREKLTPLSNKSVPFSNQFSDSYFSIDLAKSYDPRSQVGKEVSNVQKPRFVMSERINESNSGQVEEPFGLVNWPSINIDSYNVTHQNKLKAAAFFKGEGSNDFGHSRQKVVVTKNPNQSLSKWPIQDQIITKSASKRLNRSCWRKFLFCCF